MFVGLLPFALLTEQWHTCAIALLTSSDTLTIRTEQWHMAADSTVSQSR